jgi:methyl coenzyme M reductase subunit D
MCEGYVFRLFATKDGKTVDDLIKEGMLYEAVAMIEVELVALSEEIAKLQENIREIKKRLGLEIEVKE